MKNKHLTNKAETFAWTAACSVAVKYLISPSELALYLVANKV